MVSACISRMGLLQQNPVGCVASTETDFQAVLEAGGLRPGCKCGQVVIRANIFPSCLSLSSWW